MVFQPGVDVGAAVAGGAANADEGRSGALLAPAFEGAQADLELVGELLLGRSLSVMCPQGGWPLGILPGRGGLRHEPTRSDGL